MNKKAILLMWAALYSTNIFAGPADYVYTPTVESGEKEIDMKYGSAKQEDGKHESAASLGFGYGATEYWFTEIYFKREYPIGENLSLLEWENKFQLTETGKYAVDIGFITEIEAPINHSNEPWGFKVGPLFQTEFGKLQLNGNVLFERKFGQNDNNDQYVTEMGYQLQTKYRIQPEFELGLQAFGDLGEWNDWDSRNNQNHRIGPAVFGKVKVSQHQAIKYNAAWLLGVSKLAPDQTFRMQVEYEF